MLSEQIAPVPDDERCEICSISGVMNLDCECSELPVEKFSSGDLVIAEGRFAGALYFLKSGTVKIYRAGVLTATIDEPGTVLGEVSILLNRPHIAEVRAVGECEFHVAEDAAAFLRDHPNVNLYISRQLAKKVDALSCYLTDLKQQYGHSDDQMGMMHEVLDSLMHR